MLVEEISTYFRNTIDEDDTTFVTAAIEATMLKQGDRQFRQLVARYNPRYFAARVTITVSGKSYDLSTAAVKLLGVRDDLLTNTRLLALTSVASLTSAGDFSYWLTPAVDIEELECSEGDYLLEGTTLYFAASQSGDFRLTYVPDTAVDWTKTTSGDNEWVNDLEDFHDIIALFAAEHYAIRTGSELPGHANLLQRRLADLRAHLNRGRVLGAADRMPMAG